MWLCGRRQQNNPYFLSTCEGSNKRSGTRLKTESETEERRVKARALRARKTLTPRLTDFFTDCFAVYCGPECCPVIPPIVSCRALVPDNLTRSHRGHIGIPKQWNGGHVSVPNQSCGSWTLLISYACKFFLLCRYAGHVRKKRYFLRCSRKATDLFKQCPLWGNQSQPFPKILGNQVLYTDFPFQRVTRKIGDFCM